MTKRGRAERRRKRETLRGEAAGLQPPPVGSQTALTVAWVVSSLMTMVLVAASLVFLAYRLIGVAEAGPLPAALIALGAVVHFAGACTGMLTLWLHAAVRHRQAIHAPRAFTTASIVASLLALAQLALAVSLR